MGYYSDPTASAAVGGINREFSRMEKKAKRLCRLWKEGKISDEKLEQAQEQFTGIYRRVLRNALYKTWQEDAQADEG